MGGEVSYVVGGKSQRKLRFIRTVRPLLRTVLSVLSTATVWTLLVLPYPAAAQTPGVDGIKELNRHRHAAGVAPVTLSPGGAAQLHAQYLA